MNDDSTNTKASQPHDTPHPCASSAPPLRGELGSLEDRLRAKIRVEPSGCWQWIACLNEDGYAQVWFQGRGRGAHRVIYELLAGTIPHGLVIDHLCRNRGCVNPEHMEPVTQGVNVLRGEGPAAKCAAKTHCAQGHPYDETNTILDNKGDRRCRTCRIASSRRTVAKTREANRLAGKGRTFSKPRTY